MLNFHAILYDFFIEGLELDTIAAKHETSWSEVTGIVSSEPAMHTMRAAIRAEQLRDIAQNLASRRAAIRVLEGLVHDRSLTAVSHEGRRRAATAILSGTKPTTQPSRPSTRAARSKSTEPARPETPASSAQSENRSDARAPADPAQTRILASRSATSNTTRPAADPKPASSASQPSTPDPSCQTKAASNTPPPRFPSRAEKPRSNFKARRARPKSNPRAKPCRENSS